MNFIERVFEIIAENEHIFGYGGCCEIEWDKEEMRKELEELLEDLRIESIRAVDKVFTQQENVITIRLKPETQPISIDVIVMEINRLLEKIAKDEVLEVLC